MPPPRPYWKGYLKLSLVSCPIALYTATSSGERVAFRQINKKTGNRLRQQLIDEETGEPVESADKGGGYEVDKGVYIRVEDEELDAIASRAPIRSILIASCRNRRSTSVTSTVPITSSRTTRSGWRRLRSSATQCATRAGRVRSRRSVEARARRHASAMGQGPARHDARYPYEVRDDEAYFDDIAEVQIPKEMLNLAEHILDSKAASFDASKFHDRYEEAVVAMLDGKKAGCRFPCRARRRGLWPEPI